MAQVDYVIEQNPDDRVLAKAAAFLEQGGLVVLPSDTNWIVCADPRQKKAVEKLYRLKKEEGSKHFSLLCSDISMATKVASIDDHAFRLIRPLVPGHYTFIFSALKATTKMLKASKGDKQVGIRIPPVPLLKMLFGNDGFPLISTQVTHELLGMDDSIPLYGAAIDDEIGNFVDQIIDPGEYHFVGPSTVIDFSEDEDGLIHRLGAGDAHHFSMKED